jgi:hypothetical protein
VHGSELPRQLPSNRGLSGSGQTGQDDEPRHAVAV